MQREECTAEVAERMEVEIGADAYHVIMLHFQNDVPIQIEDRWVSARMVPEFLDVDFSSISPTQYLIDRFRPDEMEHIVKAKMPDEDLQEMLVISEQEPCLRLSQRTWMEGYVVTCVDFTYPSSRYELGSRYPIDK